MNTQLILTASALKDIEQITDYLAERSSYDSAEAFVSELQAKLSKISQFPNLGRPRNEISEGVRSLPIRNYLIIYIPAGKRIDILRVVSGYLDLSALFES